jgi:2-aminoadipate transaminase
MPFFKPEFAARTRGVNPSVIREILKVVAQPDIISFAGGMPAPELVPAADLAEATRRAYADPATMMAALQYGPSEGYMPLRRWIAEDLEREGIQALPEQILITTGSQQAIDLIARVLLDPGDQVVVAKPTFLGALQSFAAYQGECLGVDMDEQGMIPEALEAVLKAHKPKLIYLIPAFQNPNGISFTPERKQAIYALAREYGVPIMEDDPYGDLYFGAERPASMKSLDTADGVMLLRTFSKTLSPGLRVGYAVLPREVLSRIMPAKQSADLHTGGLNQVLIHEYLVSGKLEAHLAHIREVYRARRDVMLGALEAHFPAGCRWTKPEGGLFVWVELPEGLSAQALLEEAVLRKVAFIPGQAFFADKSGDHTCRLNFSNASEEKIVEGVKRLGEVIREAMAKRAPVA